MTVHNNMSWTEEKLAKEGWKFYNTRACFQCGDLLAVYEKGGKTLRLDEGTLEAHVCD